MATKPIEAMLQGKKIQAIMNTKLLQAGPNISLEKAISLMQENKSGYIVIADKKKVVGIITEADIVRKVLGKNVDLKSPVKEFMTPNPVVLSSNDTVGKAIDLMGEHRFYHIPLVGKTKELEGMLSVRSLIRFLAEFYPTEVYNLPPRPDQVMETPEGG